MRSAIAHRLHRYATWADDVPTRAACWTTTHCVRAGLPVTAAAVIGTAVWVAAQVDMAPKRAAARRMARWLSR